MDTVSCAGNVLPPTNHYYHVPLVTLMRTQLRGLLAGQYLHQMPTPHPKLMFKRLAFMPTYVEQTLSTTLFELFLSMFLPLVCLLWRQQGGHTDHKFIEALCSSGRSKNHRSTGLGVSLT